MPEHRKGQCGKGNRKGQMHKPRLRHDIGENADACGLRQNTGQFGCDVKLKQGPRDAQRKDQCVGKWSGLTGTCIGLGHHLIGGTCFTHALSPCCAVFASFSGKTPAHQTMRRR